MPSHAPTQGWQVMQALARRSVSKLGQGQQQLQPHLVEKGFTQPQQLFQCSEQQLRQCSRANASQHRALEQLLPHQQHDRSSSSSTRSLPLQSSRPCSCRSSNTHEVTNCDSNNSRPWFQSRLRLLLHESWGSSSSSWSHSSSRSNRAYSNRAVAATAPQILEELSRFREGDDSQVWSTTGAGVQGAGHTSQRWRAPNGARMGGGLGGGAERGWHNPP